MSWKEIKDKKQQQPKHSIGVDGYERSLEVEDKINIAFASTFKGNDGQFVLEYLRSITTDAVSGPNTDANKLFHLEGMRFLFAIIKQRIIKGKEAK